MKKILVFVTLFVLAFTAEAKRKAEKLLLDDEFNPWFQHEGPEEKVDTLFDNSPSTAKLPSKMDKIKPNSSEYEPSGMVFKRIRPNHIYIPCCFSEKTPASSLKLPVKPVFCSVQLSTCRESR